MPTAVKERNDFFEIDGEAFKKVTREIADMWPDWKREAYKQNFSFREPEES